MHNPPTLNPGRPKAFTLIELLAVMAIISLLAAILLPILQQARGFAYRTNCLSNVREIGMAALMYVHDNDDTLMSPALQRSNGLPASPYSDYYWGKDWTVWPEMLFPYHKTL